VAGVTHLLPLLIARRNMFNLIEERGIEHFTIPEPDRPPFRLDPDVLHGVIDQACRGIPCSEEDRLRCYRILRRELIQELAVGLVLAGY
jgi:hypothetical protein